MFAHRRSVSSSWSLDLSHVAVVQSVNAMGVDLFQQGGEGGSKVPGARRLSGEPRHAAKATSGEDGARNNRRGMDGISNTVHPWYHLSRWIGLVRPRSSVDLVVLVPCQAGVPVPRAGCHQRHGGGEGRMPRSGAPLECGGGRLTAHRPRTRRRHRFLRGQPSHAPVWASNRGVAGSYLVIAAGASFLPQYRTEFHRNAGGAASEWTVRQRARPQHQRSTLQLDSGSA